VPKYNVELLLIHDGNAHVGRVVEGQSSQGQRTDVHRP
jgi:hypothetical protein